MIKTKGGFTMLVRVDFPRAFDSLVEDFFSPEVFDSQLSYSTYPTLDLAEYDDESVVIAELPGVTKEDLKITVEDGWLTVSGERKPYEIPQNARVLLNEMRVCNFSRSIELPHEVDVNGISAELENGILRIRLPKSQEARPHTIQVK